MDHDAQRDINDRTGRGRSPWRARNSGQARTDNIAANRGRRNQIADRFTDPACTEQTLPAWSNCAWKKNSALRSRLPAILPPKLFQHQCNRLSWPLLATSGMPSATSNPGIIESSFADQGVIRYINGDRRVNARQPSVRNDAPKKEHCRSDRRDQAMVGEHCPNTSTPDFVDLAHDVDFHGWRPMSQATSGR